MIFSNIRSNYGTAWRQGFMDAIAGTAPENTYNLFSVCWIAWLAGHNRGHKIRLINELLAQNAWRQNREG